MTFIHTQPSLEQRREQAGAASMQPITTKERPILFSAPMVRAILAGQKTQTRRICKPAQAASLSSVIEVPDPIERGQVYNGTHFGDEEGDIHFASPHGGPGDRLWVRETFAMDYNGHKEWPVFRADGVALPVLPPSRGPSRWRPSIHMPRSASRITLKITDVRVERLQTISEDDAVNEGIELLNDFFGCPCWKDYTDPETVLPDAPIKSFKTLWQSINGFDSWTSNPWVWVVSFKRVEQAA